jgi:transcriptional regulator with XRE-family HTH domain
VKLNDWRKQQNWTLARLGLELGFVNSNPSSAAQRIERGAVKVDADLAERIRLLTNDAVRPQDLHEMRLEWLANQAPRKTEAAQ